MALPVEMVLKGTSDDARAALAKLEEKFEDLTRRVKGLNDQVRKNRQRSQDHFAKMKDDLLSAAKQWLTFAGVVAGLAKVYQMIGAEMDAVLVRQDKMAQRQIDVSGARAEAVLNLGAGADITPDQLFERLGGIAKETGVKERDVALTASNALSARGDLEATTALNAVRDTLKLMAHDTENAPFFAGASLDIAKATGMEPQEAIGLLMATRVRARTVNAQGLADNLTPGILGVTQFGDSVQESAALAAAIGQGQNDPTGRVTRTAMLQLAAQIEKYGNTLDANGDKQLKATSTIGRIMELRAKNKGADFLDGSSFQARALPTIENIVGERKGSQFKGLVDALKFMNQASLQEMFDSNRELINSVPGMDVARLDRTMSSFGDQLLGDDKQAFESVIRNRLDEIKEAVGDTKVGRDIEKLKSQLDGQTGLGDAADKIQALVESTTQVVDFARSPTMGGGDMYGFDGGKVYKTVPVLDKGTADTLRELVAEVRALAHERKSREAIKSGNATAYPRPVPSTGSHVEESRRRKK